MRAVAAREMSATADKQRIAEDERFRVIFDSVNDGIFVLGAADGIVIDANEAGYAMFGYEPDELVGRTIESLSSGMPPYTQHDAFAWFDKLRTEGPQTFEWHCKAKDGQLFWVEASVRTTWFGDREVGLAIVRDITERRRLIEELSAQARLDALTGLPNRRDFDRTLLREIARAERYGTTLCIALADIDRFKPINDDFGHQTGDVVLKRLAGVLRRRLRRVDYVARWGGEEFAILLPQTGLAAATVLLDRLRAVVADTHIAEIGQPVTISVGVVEYRHGMTARRLLRQVDRALYEAKKGGRNRVVHAAAASP
jgi:diguanylate cyclase (GGDEF)-like protein/PAS domain S-box-containing protein